MPLGVLAAQIVHAAGESVVEDVPENTHAVVLGVSYDRLLEYQERISGSGLGYVDIHESSPPYDGRLMAIGIVPTTHDKVRRFVSDAPLLK